MRLVLLHAATLLALAAAGCAMTPLEDTSRAVHAARVPGTDAVLAVLVTGSSTDAYLCGGASTLASLTRWFHAEDTVVAGRGLVLRSGDTTLTLARAGEELTAELRTDGGARFVVSPSAGAELYDAMDEGCRTGVILWPGAGGAAELQGAWCSQAGDRLQVQPLEPVLHIDRSVLSVRVPRSEGPRILQVRPVSLAGLR